MWHEISMGSRGVGAWVGGALVLAACGAGHVDAPPMETNTGATGGACGTLAEARDTFRGTARRSDLEPIGDLIRTQLVETGKWRQAVRSALEILRAEPPQGLARGLHGLRSGEGLAALTPHVHAVLRYFVGSPKLVLAPDEAFAAGPHYGPVRVTAAMLRVCQPDTTMMALHRALTVRVPCAACPGGTRLFGYAFTDAVARLLADPEVGPVLDALEFSDTSANRTAIGREAFALLLDLVVDGIASPSFDSTYFESNLRVQVNDILGRRLGPDARAALDGVMDVLGAALDPQLGLLEPLQDTLACFRRQDPGHEIASMVFDYVQIDALHYRVFIDNIADVFESEDGARVNEYLARVTLHLAQDPTLARDTVGVALPFLVDGAAERFLPAVERLQGKGVVTGALDVAIRFLDACAR